MILKKVKSPVIDKLNNKNLLLFTIVDFMARKSFITLKNFMTGLMLSIFSFFILIFLLKFFVILLTKIALPGSSYYYQTLADVTAFLMDFSNPVADVFMIIAIVLLAILYSIVLSFFKRKTARL
jgi:hypothetical protein